MKCLSLQLQPELDLAHEPRELLELVRGIGRFPEVDKSDDGVYITLNFFTEDAPSLWSELQHKVLEHADLGAWIKKIAIVVCEGNLASDEYLLLYHYDQNEKVDELPKP